MAKEQETVPGGPKEETRVKSEEDQVDLLTPKILYFLENNNEYNFFHEKRGIALVINNINFQSSPNKPRKGGEHDTKRLSTIFGGLGFDMYLYQDLTADQMFERVRRVASCEDYDHNKADCFVCIILSHGGGEKDQHGVHHDIVFGVDGRMVYARKIVNLLRDENCPHFKDKPRIFMFETCRGTEFDPGVKVFDTSNRMEPENDEQEFYHRSSSSQNEEDIVIAPTPLYKDFLVVYATPPGYTAWRSTGPKGSHFINYLEEVLQSIHEDSVPFLNILTKTSNRMALHFECKGGKKQMPCIMSMLTKDISFRKRPDHRSRDRRH